MRKRPQDAQALWASGLMGGPMAAKPLGNGWAAHWLEPFRRSRSAELEKLGGTRSKWWPTSGPTHHRFHAPGPAVYRGCRTGRCSTPGARRRHSGNHGGHHEQRLAHRRPGIRPHASTKRKRRERLSRRCPGQRRHQRCAGRHTGHHGRSRRRVHVRGARFRAPDHGHHRPPHGPPGCRFAGQGVQPADRRDHDGGARRSR